MHSVPVSEFVRVLRACRIRSAVRKIRCTRSRKAFRGELTCTGTFQRSAGGPVFSPGPYVTPGLCLTGGTFCLFSEQRVR